MSFLITILIVFFCLQQSVQAQGRTVKKGNKYDTIIVKHITQPIIKSVARQEIILPTPEFINQPYYFDKGGNRLIKLENANALMLTKKKKSWA